MAATLNTEQQERIERVVANGRFPDISSALEHAVTALETDDTLASWPAGRLQQLVEEGLQSERTEAAVSESEARTHLARLRADLIRGEV